MLVFARRALILQPEAKQREKLVLCKYLLLIVDVAGVYSRDVYVRLFAACFPIKFYSLVKQKIKQQTW